MNLTFKKKVLKFKSPIKTSRGEMSDRTVWIIYIKEKNKIGIGECAPIFGLSKESETEVVNELKLLTRNFSKFSKIASVNFAIETALLDLKNGGNGIIFDSLFLNGKYKIPINGLIWMNNFDKMKDELLFKIKSGFKCIKIKIGSINFEEEFELIKIARKYSKNIQIRLDANGAFTFDNAIQVIDTLSPFKIHSIEQPLEINSIEELKIICKKSKIPIALDEELINSNFNKIKYINPKFLVIKPSLIGGFKKSQKWIEFAKNNKIGWWITSALESNIGLNAISQWVATLNCKMYQGLGTGDLYKNNFITPLKMIKNKLVYLPLNKQEYYNFK